MSKKVNTIIKKLKNEKGAITLFVLIAILFFLIVVISLFTNNQNKKIAQTQEVQAIKENYEREVDNIDEIYQDQLNKGQGKIEVTFTEEDSGDDYKPGDWANEDIVVSVKPDDKTTIDKIVIKDPDTGEVITEIDDVDDWEDIIEDDSIIEITYKGENSREEKKETYEIKIDKVAPTLFNSSYYTQNPSGEYKSGTWTNKEVFTHLSGIEEKSGVDVIYYSTDKQTWNKLNLGKSNGIQVTNNNFYGEEIWQLQDERVEDIYFKAKDKAGNESDIVSWQLRYDTVAPTKPVIANDSEDKWTN